MDPVGAVRAEDHGAGGDLLLEGVPGDHGALGLGRLDLPVEGLGADFASLLGDLLPLLVVEIGAGAVEAGEVERGVVLDVGDAVAAIRLGAYLALFLVLVDAGLRYLEAVVPQVRSNGGPVGEGRRGAFRSGQLLVQAVEGGDLLHVERFSRADPLDEFGVELLLDVPADREELGYLGRFLGLPAAFHYSIFPVRFFHKSRDMLGFELP